MILRPADSSIRCKSTMHSTNIKGFNVDGFFSSDSCRDGPKPVGRIVGISRTRR